MLVPVRYFLKIVSEADARVVGKRGGNKLNSYRQIIFREAARNRDGGEAGDIRRSDDAVALAAARRVRCRFRRRFISRFIREFFCGLVPGFFRRIFRRGRVEIRIHARRRPQAAGRDQHVEALKHFREICLDLRAEAERIQVVGGGDG